MTAKKATRPGNYFVSNYPPYAFWKPENVTDALAALARPPRPGTPLGLYVHIPFCRKRCHFCYFKVYTGANAPEIADYVDGVIAELALHARQAYAQGRTPAFVYFGGGTPSYLSEGQLRTLTEGLQRHWSWSAVEEVTFECEPGTLSEAKLAAIRAMGVTRLSLGVESFVETTLQANNRAHHRDDVFRAYERARHVGFPQINVDLIAGMVGEDDAGWQESVERTLELAPDSVTIYQMEVPFNTTLAKEAGGREVPVADWDTKRRWVAQAFAALEAAGYHVGSAYTAVKDPAKTKFVYRDRLWQGADLAGIGVASFSHVSGVHFQNLHELPAWRAKVASGELPLYRALKPTSEELMIRELILQMKRGRVSESYFREKFGVDVRSRFSAPLTALAGDGLLVSSGGDVQLTREGLLQVDSLLPSFFLQEHVQSRQV